MDIALVGGFLFAIFSLAGGFLLEGGHLSALAKETAAIIVFGGTIGATAITASMSDLKNVPRMIKVAMFPQQQEPAQIIELIVSLADEARREGLLYLENRLADIKDPFLRKGVQLVVDGTDPDLVRSILEVELYAIEDRHHSGISIFEAAGGFAPTMGIIGTVMGLVHVLGNMSDPSSLGPSIAVAFMATLYGIASANIFFLPIGAKLASLSKKESNMKQLMIEGIVSLQAGYNPILIQERLSAFLNPANRKRENEGEEE